MMTLREVKAPEELAGMQLAITVSGEMHHAAMAATRPGRRERKIGGHGSTTLGAGFIRNLKTPVRVLASVNPTFTDKERRPGLHG